MEVWLSDQDVKDILGADLATDLDGDAFVAAVEAATGYVEEHRPELVVTVDDEEPTFAATPQLRFGTALLAFRWYSRRRATATNGDEGAVADVVSEDPDLSRMLGIGGRGRVVFGAPSLPVVDVVV